MTVKERLDQQLSARLVEKGWVRRGTRRFIGPTHLLDVLPGATGDRVTVIFGRCVQPGEPGRLVECSRLTFTDAGDLERFLHRL